MSTNSALLGSCADLLQQISGRRGFVLGSAGQWAASRVYRAESCSSCRAIHKSSTTVFLPFWIGIVRLILRGIWDLSDLKSFPSFTGAKWIVVKLAIELLFYCDLVEFERKKNSVLSKYKVWLFTDSIYFSNRSTFRRPGIVLNLKIQTFSSRICVKL